VKKLIPNNITEAIEKAKELDGLPEFKDAVEILKAQPKPDSICPECKSIIGTFFSISQLTYVVGKCSVCEEIRKEEGIKLEKQRVKKIFLDELPKHLGERGIPKRYFNATLETAPLPYKNLTVKDIHSLYLVGEKGVGKTHLACAIANFIIQNMEPVAIKGILGTFKMPTWEMPLFVNVVKLLLDLRSTQNKNSEITEKSVIEKYIRVPVLILDDIGVEVTSPWVQQTFYTLINERYNEDLITIITGNLSLDEQSDKNGDRIVSRIAEMCEVKILKGEDRRLKK
jgi:DNA replication protein DnaC